MLKSMFPRGVLIILGLVLAVAAAADSGRRPNGLILRDLWPVEYRIDKLRPGKPLYIDQSAFYLAVPADYLELDYLLTAESHAAADDAEWISIVTNSDVIVFVGYDARISNLPQWLRGWSVTGDQWKTSETLLNVFRRSFPAGMVTLGGNNSAQHSMYTVALKRGPSGQSAPEAFNDFALTESNNGIVIKVQSNDKGLLDLPLALQVLSQPLNGSAVPTSRLGVHYVPNPGFVGTDGFIYRITDGDGDFDTGVVTLQVIDGSSGDQPRANNDLAVVPRGDKTSVDVLANDTGLTDAPISVSVALPPTNGSALVLGDNRIRYIPDADFTGVEHIHYMVTDTDGSSDAAVLSVFVYSLNVAMPVAIDDLRTVAAGANLSVAVLNNDTGLDDSPVTVSIVQQPANGTALVRLGEFVDYSPDGGFAGADAITYRVTDIDGDQSEAQVQISVFVSNSPPTISGSAPETVVAGSSYSFTPQASDPDPDDILEFSIANQPAWATFDSTTGQLNGTPGSADAGSTPGVTINVSDGTDSASLPAFDITVVEVTVASVTLTWDPPVLSADGSPLDDLAGYTIYKGVDPADLVIEATIPNPGVSAFMIENLTPDTYWFTVTATDITGNESAQPSPVSKTITQQ